MITHSSTDTVIRASVAIVSDHRPTRPGYRVTAAATAAWRRLRVRTRISSPTAAGSTNQGSHSSRPCTESRAQVRARVRGEKNPVNRRWVRRLFWAQRARRSRGSENVVSSQAGKVAEAKATWSTTRPATSPAHGRRRRAGRGAGTASGAAPASAGATWGSTVTVTGSSQSPGHGGPGDHTHRVAVEVDHREGLGPVEQGG